MTHLGPVPNARRLFWRESLDTKGRVGLYKVGDKVVYPHHGAGTVVKKESRRSANT
jgi:hypothetical protein